MTASYFEKKGWIAAFLLVIPGFTLIGAGVGLAYRDPASWTVIGLGPALLPGD